MKNGGHTRRPPFRKRGAVAKSKSRCDRIRHDLKHEVLCHPLGMSDEIAETGSVLIADDKTNELTHTRLGHAEDRVRRGDAASDDACGRIDGE